MNNGKPPQQAAPQEIDAPTPLSKGQSTKYLSIHAIAGWLEAKITKPTILMAKGNPVGLDVGEQAHINTQTGTGKRFLAETSDISTSLQIRRNRV